MTFPCPELNDMPSMHPMNRRNFTKLSTVAVAGLVAPPFRQETELQSEFLLDLTIDAATPHEVGPPGAGRLVVPVAGGSFEGPRLKGTIVPPTGDWIVERTDGSRVLDVRALLQTDDAQTIFISWRGVAYTQSDGSLFARILPMFETQSAKYAWLNNVVGVGVYRPLPHKIRYRVFRVL
jgi:Protein of unknown function (DUF3237)